MFLDSVLYDLLTAEYEKIRTDASRGWLEDAFWYLKDKYPKVYSEIVEYMTKYKFNVYWANENTEPLFPCVIIIGGSASTNLGESIGDSWHKEEITGTDITSVRFRYDTELTNIKLMCLTRNHDQTFYLWLATQLLISANRINLLTWFGLDKNGNPIGFHGLEVKGVQSSYEYTRSPDNMAWGRDILVNGKFECTVGERKRHYPITSIQAIIKPHTDYLNDPYADGEYS